MVNLLHCRAEEEESNIHTFGIDGIAVECVDKLISVLFRKASLFNQTLTAHRG